MNIFGGGGFSPKSINNQIIAKLGQEYFVFRKMFCTFANALQHQQQESKFSLRRFAFALPIKR